LIEYPTALGGGSKQTVRGLSDGRRTAERTDEEKGVDENPAVADNFQPLGRKVRREIEMRIDERDYLTGFVSLIQR